MTKFISRRLSAGGGRALFGNEGSIYENQFIIGFGFMNITPRPRRLATMIAKGAPLRASAYRSTGTVAVPHAALILAPAFSLTSATSRSVAVDSLSSSGSSSSSSVSSTSSSSGSISSGGGSSRACEPRPRFLGGARRLLGGAAHSGLRGDGSYATSSSAGSSGGSPASSDCDDGTAAASAAAAAAAGWAVDVAGYTARGFMADGTPGGGKRDNQDRAVIVDPFGRPGRALVALFDGHGANGHHVAAFLAQHLPRAVHHRLSDAGAAAGSGGGSSSRGDSRAGGPRLVRPVPHADAAPWAAAFSDADRLLCGSGLDVLESGSTAAVCHIDLAAGKLTTAWVGDSRAVLAARPAGGWAAAGGREQLQQRQQQRQQPGGNGDGLQQDGGGGWRVVALSDDHKPERPDEKVRILLSGGRVEQMRDALGRRGGPHRVWFPAFDWPGLAMSRAFGDLPCRRLGVVPEPEVTVVDLRAGSGGRGGGGGGGGGGGEEELLLVVASDGVWDRCGNEAAAAIAGAAPSAAEAARRLVEAAGRGWREADASYVDDITAVVARLRPVRPNRDK